MSDRASLPSYKLSKKGETWWAEGELPSGKPFKIDCGKVSRDRADGFAEVKLRHKVASSTGSQARWEKWRARRAAGGGTRIEPSQTVSPGSPVSPPAPAPAARPSDDELRAKLLSLRDGQPIAPDSVFEAEPSGAAADPSSAAASEDEPDDLDTEGAELIASLLAKGATVGLVALVNRKLAKRRPPQQAEPHEKGLEWFHDGMEHHLTKLLGRTATLGPTGKIFAGAAIIVGSMYMNAEPIDGAGAAPAHHETPPPAPAPPPVHANGTNPAAESTALTRPAPTGIPLGVFGVEKTVAN